MKPELSALIRLLASGAAVSGREIGESLSVSRTSVSNWVAALENYGLQVHKSPGAGYRLHEPLDLLSDRFPPEIDFRNNQFKSVEILDSVDSTNRLAIMSLANTLGLRGSGAEPGVPASGLWLVLAEHQSAGRGRRGRRWASPFGKNIYLSIALRFYRPMQELSGLSLVVGIAVVQVLRRFGLASPALKWPNDILSEGRKLAGILIDAQGELDGPVDISIGVGLNVAMQAGLATSDISQPWTSLQVVAEEAGVRLPPRRVLAQSVAEAISSCLQQFISEGFGPFVATWAEFDAWAGMDLQVTSQINPEGHDSPASILGQGRNNGVDLQGRLLLLDPGTRLVKAYSGGEISVRKQAKAAP